MVGTQETVPLLRAEGDVFRERFNRFPYEFRHRLAGHPVFAIENLVDLARRTAGRENPHSKYGDAYFDMGDVQVDQRWSESGPRTMSIAEAVEGIRSANAWIILKHLEREPTFQKLLEDYLSEALRLSGQQLAGMIKWAEAIVFVTSPNRVTTYHVDRECSWLLQIQGAKEIHVFDPGDRDVTPETELERFWTVDNNAGVYKKDLQNRANVFQMKPGTGVHIPVNAPHWLKNGGDISISLNINLQFRDHLKGNAYRANYYLRRLGFNPTPPGKSAWRDNLKSASIGAAYDLKDFLTGTRSRSRVARETAANVDRMLARGSAR